MGANDRAERGRERERGWQLRRLVVLCGALTLLGVMSVIVLAGDPPPPPPPPTYIADVEPEGTTYAGLYEEDEEFGNVVYSVNCTGPAPHNFYLNVGDGTYLEDVWVSGYTNSDVFSGHAVKTTPATGVTVTGGCTVHNCVDTDSRLVILKLDVDAEGLADDDEAWPGLFYPADTGPLELTFDITPDGLPDSHAVSLCFNSPFSIYENSNKTGEIEPYTDFDPDYFDGGKTLYLYTGSDAPIGGWQDIAFNYQNDIHMDRLILNVIQSDMDFFGVTDANEYAPGAINHINYDDDDTDSVVDYADTDGVVGEDELVKLTIQDVPLPWWYDGSDDPITLSWTGSAKVYETSTKVNGGVSSEITSGKQYVLGDLPKDVYAEGIQADKTEFTLSYTHPTSGVTHADLATLITAQVDIDAEGLDDVTEDTDGVYIGLNDDDDDGDGIIDNVDAYVAFGEDNLVALTLIAAPENLPDSDTVTISWTTGNPTKVKMFSSVNRTGEITNGTIYNPNELPGTIYMEGVSPSDNVRDIQVNLEYKRGATLIVSDMLKATVVKVDLHALAPFDVADTDEVTIGTFIGVNDDDDDGDDLRDIDDASVIPKDDEFANLVVSLHPTAGLPSSDTVEVSWQFSFLGHDYRYPVSLYETDSKTEDAESTYIISGTEYLLNDVPDSFYVEARDACDAYVTLSYKHGGNVVHSDVVKIVGVKVYLPDRLYGDNCWNIQYSRVGLNDDDDDGDGLVDLMDTDVAGEDDLESLHVSVKNSYLENPFSSNDYIVFDAANSLSGDINVYLTASRGTPFQGSKTWFLSDSELRDVFVEGIGTASTGQFDLEYFHKYGMQEKRIYLYKARVRIVKTNLDDAEYVDADVDVEEDTPGIVVGFNVNGSKILLLNQLVTAPVEEEVVHTGAYGNSPELEVCWTSGAKINLLANSEAISNGQRYSLADFPEALDMEKVSASASVGDIEVVLRKWSRGWYPPDIDDQEADYPELVCHQDRVRYTFIQPDLDVTGLDELDEVVPGAVVRLNSDDDDNDQMADNVDTDGVTGEDDLLKITLQDVRPFDLSDTDTVTLAWGNPVKVYTTATKWNVDTSSQINSPKSFELGDLPLDLYVEGSSSGQTEIDLTYVYAHYGRSVPDTDSVVVTVIGSPIITVDMDAPELSEADEYDIGAVISINDNDSDTDGIADDVDTDVVGGDPDFMTVTILDLLPSGLPDTDTVTLAWTGPVKVYETDSKSDNGSSSEITSGKEYALGDLARNIYVEGAGAGKAVMTLEYSDVGSGVVYRDNITVRMPEVDLDGYGVADTEELSTGAMIPLNDDSEIYEHLAGGPQTWQIFDNDLVRLELSATPQGLTDTETVEISWTNSSKIKVYDDIHEWYWENMPDPISSGTVYGPSSVPGRLYVEGVEVSSSAKDIEFTLRYKHGTNVIREDKVKATVVKADIDIEGVDEEEEIDPSYESGIVHTWYPDDTSAGAYYTYNFDDDDTDAVEDRLDPSVFVADTEGVIVKVDDDLLPMTIQSAPFFPYHKVRLVFSSPKLYETNTKVFGYGPLSSEIFSGTSYGVNLLPKTVYLEGIYPDAGPSVIRLEYLDAADNVIHADEIFTTTLP